MLLGDTKKELRRLDTRAKKGLGQNFLVDKHVLDRIVSAAKLTRDDYVVEVGPGLGVLTQELAQSAGRVVAVELDSTMVAVLREKFADSSNVEIVEADILKCAPESLISDERDYKVIGALPYNIASAVLRHFLEAEHKPTMIVAVIQKEVAQSIAAQPGDMGLLSVGVQLYGKPSIVKTISPRSFHPQPKVDSAILRIDVYRDPPVRVEDEVAFFDVVRGGFSTPRKQLRNSLSYGLHITSQESSELLESAGIDPRRRAETLSIEEWAKLYRVFSGKQ
ncbi:MAG: 16S rRNA (adenine(1518)-N(6)/adenine(1519)-N(6))-dimethyltransferase RsmA [Dehalococcoidia bacterium]|jgi:16S rRNA (adenine1518-N6/adenine1519-N6)-dimethyltransferase